MTASARAASAPSASSLSRGGPQLLGGAGQQRHSPRAVAPASGRSPRTPRPRRDAASRPRPSRLRSRSSSASSSHARGDRLDLGDLELEEVQVALARRRPGRAISASSRSTAARGRRGGARTRPAARGDPRRRTRPGSRSWAEATISLRCSCWPKNATSRDATARSSCADTERPCRYERVGPVRHHAAAEHQLRLVERDALRELRQLRIGGEAGRRLEHALDVCLLRAGAHDAAARLAAQQQVERLRQHRLPGAGLARDRVQPAVEGELRALDQEQVPDAQLDQHAATCISRPGYEHEAASPRPKVCASRLRRSPQSQLQQLLAEAAVEARAGQLREADDVRLEGDLALLPAGQLSGGACRRSRCRSARRPRSPPAARPRGAATIARETSACGAIRFTTNPSTPQATIGPPTERL